MWGGGRRIHSVTTLNIHTKLPYVRGKYGFTIDPSLSFSYVWTGEGPRGSEAEPQYLVLPPSFSMIKFGRTFDFPCNHFHEDQRVWGNLWTQSTLSFQGPFPTLLLSDPIRFGKHFPYSAFHESIAQSANLCQFLLYSAERFPLPSLGSTRLLWFLTGGKWKCTVGAHWLFPSQTQARVWATDLSYQETDLLASV